MVSIIKNQLLKHLSRYTKNLSSDKINISTFRGEGELSNLQFDEDVLNELLELPGWLRITSAWCNHVSFRISWTKLKSVPITMLLDEVNVTLETCELDANGRRPGGNSSSSANAQTPSAAQPQGKYSFIHKIVDGITIVVNTVNVKFNSPAFSASVQMSRIRVESKTPRWLSGDLRVTRLKDAAHVQLLIFKELSWQTVRIEASSSLDPALTPLRLLTNQARCRITIKKRASDCSILSSRLVLILDDLLWVLTDSQLKAALHFVDSLAILIKQSTQLTQRIKAQKKLAQTMPEFQRQHHHATASQPHPSTATKTGDVSAEQRYFNMYDVHETSYHFFSQRIDLHLCDDAGEGRSCYPELKDGGALQISIQGFQVDYYPFHLAVSGRSHWPKYKEAALAPALWLEQSLSAFRESLLNRSPSNRNGGSFAPHAPLERATNNPTTNAQTQSPQSPSLATPTTGAADSPYRRRCMDSLNRLMTACVVVRIEDFTLYRVTTSGRKQMPKEFVSCDKDRYSFPADLSTIHAEFTYFYYPGDSNFPLPPNKMFVHVNPVQIHFHLDSCLWFNAFALNLHESLLRNSSLVGDETLTPQQQAATSAEPGLMYMDVKFEAIMPRIVFEAAGAANSGSSGDCAGQHSAQRDRPKAMQVQISRLLATNIRELGATRADLAQALHSLQEGSLVFASDFPARSDDLCVVTDRILAHVAATDISTTSNASTPNSTSSQQQLQTPTPSSSSAAAATAAAAAASQPELGRYAFCAEPRDVWCIKIDPLWIDFLGARSVGQSKCVPFVDAVPITLWLHGRAVGSADAVVDEQKQQQQQQQQPQNDDTSPADLHVIAHIANMVSVQIDHFQYLFLLRLAEEITELSTFVSLDADRITHVDNANASDVAKEKSIVFGCVVPQLELTLVMPSQTPGKESSGCDAESVVPDSVSICEDIPSGGIQSMLAAALEQQQQQQQQQQQHVHRPMSVMTTSMISTTSASAAATAGNGAIFSDGIVSPTNSATIVSPKKPPIQPQQNSAVNIPSASSAAPSSSRPNSSSGGGSNNTRPRNSMGGSSETSSGFKEFGSSLLTMKKGFSNFMTSIDSALKSGPSSAMDDASDSFSIRSDISSDSENFQLVLDDDRTTDCLEVMFNLNPFGADQNTLKASAIEVASEVCEEDAQQQQQSQQHTNVSSPSEPSDGHSWRRRDLVSMVTFRLTTVEVIHQTVGRASSVRLQLSALTCDECAAIPWDELQTKFGARCRAWNIAPYNPEAPPCVQLRLDEVRQPPADVGIIADKKTVLDWFSSSVEVRVKDLNLDLSMSSVIGLVDLAEDEIIGKPLPAEILLENVRLHLVEDRPPVNVTSPGTQPIDLSIGCMRIIRDSTGVINLQPSETVAVDPTQTQNTSPQTTGHGSYDDGAAAAATATDRCGRDREVLSLQLVMQQLKLDNEHLKWQLRLNEKSTENVIHNTQQESDLLKNCLNKAQQDIAALLTEKQTLLNTVRSLQKQLLARHGTTATIDGDSLAGDSIR